MARLQAQFSVDMKDLASTVGETIHTDNHSLVVRSGLTETRFVGDFSYPGDAWTGTIEAVFVKHRGVDWWGVTGIELDAAFTQSAGRLSVLRDAFSGADTVIGSGQVDRLVGYGGNDVLTGRAGDDVLLGGRGKDVLIGGSGYDLLKGQRGNDVLDGGQGNDRLFGGQGADRFVFGGSDGVDRVKDFGKGADKIVIEDGAESFDDLTITKVSEGVRVSFDETVIILEDVARHTIGADDFIF